MLTFDPSIVLAVSACVWGRDEQTHWETGQRREPSVPGWGLPSSTEDLNGTKVWIKENSCRPVFKPGRWSSPAFGFGLELALGATIGCPDPPVCLLTADPRTSQHSGREEKAGPTE